MKYLCDLDTGIDDALALVTLVQLLKNDPSSSLIGVTASYGNVQMEQSARNSLAVLSLFGADDVPVYLGVKHASGMRSFEVAPGVELIHGRNGLGEQNIPDTTRKPEQMPAATFMARAAEKYGSDLTIIATGALTNLADALQLRPSMAHEVGRIVIMGTAVTVPGSINAWTEANVGEDPESAQRVLSSGAHLMIVGRDVTTTTVLTKKQSDAWAQAETARGKFLAGMLAFYIHAYNINYPGLGGCFISDPTATVLAVHPELITQSLYRHLKVELDGPTRGRTIGDLAFGQKKDMQTQTVLQLNLDAFYHTFFDAVAQAIA